MSDTSGLTPPVSDDTTFVGLLAVVDQTLAMHRQDERITLNRGLVLELRACVAACAVLAQPPSVSHDRDSRELNSIATTLNLEWDDLRQGWWLPAEPGPILCPTIAQAVVHALVPLANAYRVALAEPTTGARE